MVLRWAPDDRACGQKGVGARDRVHVHDNVWVQVQRLGQAYLARLARAGGGRSAVNQKLNGQSYEHLLWSILAGLVKTVAELAV